MVRDFVTAHVGLLYELSGVLLALFLLIVVAALLLARLERLPLDDALYFAFITAFTVGLGDIVPTSRLAKAVTVGLAFVGVILAGVMVAIAVKALETVVQVT